jgi:Mrp family chromosome partitioning ATPase
MPDMAEMLALYGALRSFLDEKPGAVVHCVAAARGEGTSTIAGELARLVATTGHRKTLLLDADRHSRRTTRPDGSGSVGLIDCLLNHRDLEQAIQSVPNTMLALGWLVGPNSQPAVEAEAVKTLYGELRQIFQLTIVDCPSVASGAYSDLIPEAADGIILVVQAEKTRPAVVAHAKNLIQQAGGNIIGAVLNRRRSYIPNFLYRSI